MIGRRIRGVIRNALTWSVGWGALLAAVAIFATWGHGISLRIWITVFIRDLLGGAINGAIFAALLAWIGRGRTIATLSLTRIATCGFIGGLTVPLISYLALPANVRSQLTIGRAALGLGFGAVIGAALGAASLLIARRARDGSSESPPEIGPGAASPVATRARTASTR